jgi:hypothetical protein
MHADAGTAGRGLAARVIGVVVSPRTTYADVAARPRTLGVLGVVMLVTAAVWFAFLSTDVGQDALYNQRIDAIESFGIQMPEPAYEQMEAQLTYAPYFTAVSQLVFLPLMATIISGLIIGVFNAVMGGNATFRQVFAVVAHSGVILALHSLFMAPLDYARAAMTSPSTLRAFTPFLAEGSFAGRLTGSIDLFYVWWIVNLSIGVGVLYGKRTAPIALTALALYLTLALIIAAVWTRLAGA